MTYQTIIDLMGEYLHRIKPCMAEWLDIHLIKGEGWRESLVLSALSKNQRIAAQAEGKNELSDFSLPELLRIADKNWYTITHKHPISQTVRDLTGGIMSLYHRLCSGASVSPEMDLKLLKDFGAAINVDKTLLKEINSVIGGIKADGVADVPKKAAAKESNSGIRTAIEIKQGDAVRLKSDLKINGYVVAVNKVGRETKYTVFAENSMKEFFGDQIELYSSNVSKKNITAGDLRRRLTARQILSPSNQSLYSLNAAKIDFVPYQFRPVLKLIKSGTPRLLVADGVGVGKTIEAGLILKELQARQPLETIIIICPKPLVSEHKWRREMKEKFGEDFLHADSSVMRNIIRDYERDGFWDRRYNRLIIPYSILTDKLLNGDGKRHSGFANLDPPPCFDLLIVDEAHNIRNPDTQQHEAVKFFCEHTTAITFLTATPIQLGDENLFTLLNLLFPDVVIDKASFDAMAEPNAHINRAVSLLRGGRPESETLDELREAAGTNWGRNVIAPNPAYSNAVALLEKGVSGREQRLALIDEIESLHSFSRMINRTRRQDIGDFCMRRVHTLDIDFTEQQRELHDELLNFERDILSRLRGAPAAKFMMSTICRQASSSLFGIAPFIGSMLERRFGQLIEEFDEDSEEMSIDIDELAADMERIIKLAENLSDDDPKFLSVRDILAARQGVKTIIFSSFRHTLNYLHKRIKKELELRTEQVNGSVGDEDRYSLRNRFSLPTGDPNAIDVLLFTEVGSEGLDYQFCDTMINYDLPWNPMRIEQRIGRIDRRGQQSEVVHIYNCVVNGTIDADIYHRCFERIGIFEKSLGECSEILGGMEKSIKDIVFDSELTDEERGQKFDKMADNEISLIKESRRLEDGSKDIFGINMTDYTSEIAKADNPWVCAENMRNLIVRYLENRLGDGKTYISAGKLTLSADEKQRLLDDYQEIDDTDKVFETYLKDAANRIPIVFSQEEAKDTRNCLFITPTHPLARQAAAGVTGDTATVTLKICGNEIPKGSYPFLLYSWQYTGSTPRTEFIIVCEDDGIEPELKIILQYAASGEADFADMPPEWKTLEEKHADLWRKARNLFLEQSSADCLFRVESLKRSLAAQTANPRKQLEQNPEQRIETMYRSQIERLERDFESKKNRIEQSAGKADIHAVSIAKGVLINE